MTQKDWRWSKCVSPPTNYSGAFIKVLQAWVSKRSFNLPENLSGSHARAYFHITPFRFWVIRQSVYCLPFIFLIFIIVLTSWWLSVFALPDSSTGLNAYLIICHRYHTGVPPVKKRLVRRRNFRLLHICLAEKAQISPTCNNYFLILGVVGGEFNKKHLPSGL